MAVEKPNIKHATKAPCGFHFPKTIAERAIKPWPVTIVGLNAEDTAILNVAPPKPAKTPPAITTKYWIFATLMPKVSAALGYSPIARILKPNLVFCKINQTTGTNKKAMKVVWQKIVQKTIFHEKTL